MSITNAELAAKLQATTDGYQSFVAQQIGWLVSEADSVTLTDPYDPLVSVSVPTVFKLVADYENLVDPASGLIVQTQAQLDAATALVADAVAAQSTFDGYNTTFTGYVAAADADRIAAEAARDGAQTFSGAASTSATAADASAVAAAASALAAATSASEAAADAADAETARAAAVVAQVASEAARDAAVAAGYDPAAVAITGGSITGLTTLQVGANDVWHAGNFDPSSLAPNIDWLNLGQIVVNSETVGQLKVKRPTPGNVRVDIARPSLDTEVAQLAFLTGETLEYQIGMIASDWLRIRSVVALKGLAVDTTGKAYAENGLDTICAADTTVPLQAIKGSPVTAPAWTVNDLCVLAADAGTNGILQILTASNKAGGIHFSDQDARGAGSISYDHANTRFGFVSEATTLGLWDTTALQLYNGLTVAGTINSSGQIRAKGAWAQGSTAAIRVGTGAAGGAGSISFDRGSDGVVAGFVGFLGASDASNFGVGVGGGSANLVLGSQVSAEVRIGTSAFGGTAVQTWTDTGASLNGSFVVTGDLEAAQAVIGAEVFAGYGEIETLSVGTSLSAPQLQATTYTPTWTNESNVSAVTILRAHAARTANIVEVTVACAITSSSSAFSAMYLTLPSLGTITSHTTLYGTVTSLRDTVSQLNFGAGVVRGDNSSGTRALVQFQGSSNTGSSLFVIKFSYQVS